MEPITYNSCACRARGVYRSSSGVFLQTAQNTKKIERLEERMDKRFTELISTMNQQISDVRSEISNVRSEISDVRSEISDVRGEIRDVRLELSKLNQNHIDHLTHHN